MQIIRYMHRVESSHRQAGYSSFLGVFAYPVFPFRLGHELRELTLPFARHGVVALLFRGLAVRAVVRHDNHHLPYPSDP